MSNYSKIDCLKNLIKPIIYNTMIEDTFPAAEKILSDIENVFKKDPHLTSFDIIPTEDNKNKSPVFYDEHSLGLASWCVQPLYCYAHNKLFDLRRNKHKREEPSTVTRWLLGALLLNPKVITFWNMRRELVKSNRIDPLREFRFINVVQYNSPKCFEAFAYRRWLIKFVLLQDKHSNIDIVSILQGEIRAANVAAERYSNNCYAWDHRQHAIAIFENVAVAQLYNTLCVEWKDCAKWCEQNISDYSGFAYRQFLLKKLLFFKKCTKTDSLLTEDNFSKRRQIILKYVKICRSVSLDNCSNNTMLDILHGTESKEQMKNVDYDHLIINLSYLMEELMLNKDLIYMFPGHEALWHHRRFLAYSLKALNISFLKFREYRSEVCDDREEMRLTVKANEGSSLLELAFRDHNRVLISYAKSDGQHHANLAEKFVKFLSIIELTV